MFRVAPDQLKLRGGLVRCGDCRHVFDAIGTLNYIDDAALSTSAPAPQPAVDAVIAAIRKAESAAGDASSMEDASPPPPAPATSGDLQLLSPPPASGEASPTDVPAASETAEQITEDDKPRQPPTPEGVDRAADTLAADAPARDAADVGPLADQASAVESPPAFLRANDPPKRRGLRRLLGAGAVALAALALAQLAVAFRAEILASYPNARPALTELCKVFRCTVGWPMRGDLLAVIGSELQSLPGTSAFELTAVVRNRGNFTQELPAIELTLSDTLNRTVARKVFVPADYLAGDSDADARVRAGLPAGADLTVRIAFEARDINAAGFVVYPFYL